MWSKCAAECVLLDQILILLSFAEIAELTRDKKWKAMRIKKRMKIHESVAICFHLLTQKLRPFFESFSSIHFKSDRPIRHNFNRPMCFRTIPRIQPNRNRRTKIQLLAWIQRINITNTFTKRWIHRYSHSPWTNSSITHTTRYRWKRVARERAIHVATIRLHINERAKLKRMMMYAMCLWKSYPQRITALAYDCHGSPQRTQTGESFWPSPEITMAIWIVILIDFFIFAPIRIIVSYVIRYQRVDIEHAKYIDICIPHNLFRQQGNSHIIPDLVGNYSFTVVANSLAGSNTRWSSPVYFEIDESSISGAVIALIVVLVIIAIGAFGAIIYFYRRRYGPPDSGLKLIASVNPEYVSMQYTPDEWEIPRDRIIQLNELGQGSFGNTLFYTICYCIPF